MIAAIAQHQGQLANRQINHTVTLTTSLVVTVVRLASQKSKFVMVSQIVPMVQTNGAVDQLTHPVIAREHVSLMSFNVVMDPADQRFGFVMENATVKMARMRKTAKAQLRKRTFVHQLNITVAEHNVSRKHISVMTSTTVQTDQTRKTVQLHEFLNPLNPKATLKVDQKYNFIVRLPVNQSQLFHGERIGDPLVAETDVPKLVTTVAVL